MKVVYLGNYNTKEILSGPEKVASRLFENSYKLGTDSVFIEYFFKEYADRNFFNRSIGWKVLNEKPKIIRAGIIPLICYLIRKRPDIIHIVTLKRFVIIPLLLKNLFGSKIVVTFHGIIKYEVTKLRGKMETNYLKKFFYLERLLINSSDLIVFLSDIQKELAKKYYRINNSKTKILPNGIDDVFFNRYKRINNKKKRNIVFYNGTNYDLKRFEYLFDILIKLNQGTFELFIIGDCEDIFESKYCWIKKVSFFTPRQLSNFLQDKDIFINCSEFDSFSLMTVEAMAAGLVVIVSDKVGMKKYINDKQNGFVFNYDNPQELEIILREILTGNINIKNISENAIKIYSELNWEKVAKLYIDCYKELIKRDF